jgi:hypothetical protein
MGSFSQGVYTFGILLALLFLQHPERIFIPPSIEALGVSNETLLKLMVSTPISTA